LESDGLQRPVGNMAEESLLGLGLKLTPGYPTCSTTLGTLSERVGREIRVFIFSSRSLTVDEIFESQRQLRERTRASMRTAPS
jgi:hypothetical protein